MASVVNPRAVRWLRDELPRLIAAGTITPETADAIERYYAKHTRTSRNFGVVLLASLGSALVAAGIILLIAHNWDDFSRTLRSGFAFLPLVCAQALCVFVLLRRNDSQPWRECAAIFNVAAIGTAISLVSQTYQIQGSFTDFMTTWLLLGIPVVYLMRTTFGAFAYLVGTGVWAADRGFSDQSPSLFWLLLALSLPYLVWKFRSDRHGREIRTLAITICLVITLGVAATSWQVHGRVALLSFAGFFTLVYLCGIEFFSPPESGRLSALAWLGGLAIGGMSIVLTFHDIWKETERQGLVTSDIVNLAILLAFPVVAIVLAVCSWKRHGLQFSVLAASFPLVTAAVWALTQAWRTSEGTLQSYEAAFVFDLFALCFGIELIARGMKAENLARANFGLLVIAALAIARFFDSDLSFVTRAIGFIVIGVGFLLANVLLFRRRKANA